MNIPAQFGLAILGIVSVLTGMVIGVFVNHIYETLKTRGVFSSNQSPVPRFAKILIFSLSIALSVFTTLKLTNTNTPIDSSIGIDVNEVLKSIEIAPDTQPAAPSWWHEVDSGKRTETIDPEECFGAVWNVDYMQSNQKYSSRRTVVVFTSPREFQFHEDGWYVKICVDRGVSISPQDVGEIQAALLRKKHWDIRYVIVLE